MAAKWLEDPTELDEPTQATETPAEEEETLQAVSEEVEEQTPEPEVEDDLPEKYRGKSAAEIARMHMELERLQGRQSTEVGELRKAFDEFVTRDIASRQPEPAQTKPVDPVDFFTDPDAAIEAKIANDPRIKQAEQTAAAMQAQASKAALERTHPDYAQVVSDPAFAEWVKASRIRMELFARADRNYDFESANELISTWKERKGAAQKAVEAEKSTRTEQAKAASAGASKPAVDTAGVTKKKYRRADIIKLMRTDPDRYEAMQDEILQAYKEKRVIS